MTKMATKIKKVRVQSANDRPLAYEVVTIEEMLDTFPVVVALDLETTGFSWDGVEKDRPNTVGRITELAAIKYDSSGTEIAAVERLVKIDCPISDFITGLTHITDDMLQTEGIELSQVLDEFEALLEDGVVIIGHNAQFDLAFLTDAYAALERPMPKLRAFCSWQEGAKRLFPDAPDNKLGTVAKALGVELVEAHRAGPDTRAAYEVARKLVERFKIYPVPRGVKLKHLVPHPVRDEVRREIESWRDAKAAELGVPAWKVLTYVSYEGILSKLPNTLEDLSKLPGFTSTQLATYGVEIMERVEAARAKASATFGILA